MLPKLQEKRAIGQACSDFDHTVLIVRRATHCAAPPTAPRHPPRRATHRASPLTPRAAAPQTPSGNEKRRQEGKQVRSKGAKRARSDGAKVCWDFSQKGECKFGDGCRFAHGDQPPVPATAGHADGAEQAAEVATEAAAVAATETESGQADQGPSTVTAGEG